MNKIYIKIREYLDVLSIEYIRKSVYNIIVARERATRERRVANEV